jgi:SAM-dependent methyltransferase
MIASDQDTHYDTPNEWDDWLVTSPGKYVLDWEARQYAKAVEDAFGFDALQIGLPQLSCLSANRIPHRWQMLLCSQTFTNQIQSPHIQILCQSSIYDLPFENESVDLIALPHVLEFTENPHEALREVHRILRPEGRIVISGFNPESLWGLRQMAGRLFDQPFLPRSGQFIGHRRIKDWLNLLNYSIDRGKFGCYGIPLKKSMRLQGTTFLDKVGDRWWPFFGSVFLLSAVKRIPGHKMVGLVRSNRALLPTALKPATQNHQSKPKQSSHES